LEDLLKEKEEVVEAQREKVSGRVNDSRLKRDMGLCNK
jgi:hypothetical protein